MANDKFPLGRKAVAYYNTGDLLIDGTTTADAAAWLADLNTVPAPQIRNLTLNLESQRADTNTRESTAGGFMSETPVLKNATITFDTPWDLSSAWITKMLAAWDGDTQICLGFLNRDKDDLGGSGDIVNGFVGNCWVSLTRDENADDVLRANFTVTHATFGEWYEMVGP